MWQGRASASAAEGRNSNQGGLAALLIGAIVNQLIETTADASFRQAGIASQRLLYTRKNGLLYGPRSPKYETD